MKRIISICFACVLLIGTYTSFNATFATSIEDQELGSKLINNDSVEVIKSYVEAMNNQDTDVLIALCPNEEKDRWVSYFNDDARKHTGIRGILKAEIAILEPIEDSLVMQNTDLDYYVEEYGDTVEGYLVGTMLEVDKEDEFFHNGLNIHLVITANEDGEKKIVEYSEASLLLLSNMFDRNLKNKDADLESVFKYKEAKSQGLIIGSNGNVIDTNIATPEQLMEERGNLDRVSNQPRGVLFPYTRPEKIKVYVDGKTIKEIDFYEYCKNVLPNEWGKLWPSESLKAGAMCVKMVGWFRVESPKYPSLGYDITDEARKDQRYIANSATTACTNAINAVGSTGIQSASYLFYPAYLAGREGYYEVGGWKDGTVSQWGTKKFADDGTKYLDMLHYYYDYTKRLDGNLMYTFTY